MRKPIVSVTSKDFRWDFYNGQGKGGQNRNKRENCCRCFHDPSGACGKSEDERSQDQNKRLAFKRCVNTKEFKDWIKLETMRKSGEMAAIEQKVEQEMKKVKVEKKNEKGLWENWE